MKKHTVFIMALCHTLVWAAVYIAIPNSLCSCSLYEHLCQSEYETVEFILPKWPAFLPALDGWNIQLDNSETKFVSATANTTDDGTSFSCTVNRNKPYFFIAFPVTGGKNFFNCAGAVYPFSCQPDTATVNLTWSGGYAANLMKILKAQKACSEEYLLQFNWEKLMLTLKQQDSTFNPWLLNTRQVLESIAYHNFSVYKLRPSDILCVQTGVPLFSSYVPQNTGSDSVYIKKGETSLFLLDDGSLNQGVIIYGTSLKNISLEFISMPIYSRGI